METFQCADQLELTGLLLLAGMHVSHIEATDDDGHTAMMHAAANGHLPVVKVRKHGMHCRPDDSNLPALLHGARVRVSKNVHRITFDV